MTRLWSTPTRDRPTKAIAAPPAAWTATITSSRATTSPNAGGHESKRGVGSDVGGKEAAAAEPLRARRREAAEHEHHLEHARHPDGRRPDREGDEEGGRRTCTGILSASDQPVTSTAK